MRICRKVEHKIAESMQIRIKTIKITLSFRRFGKVVKRDY